MSLGSVGVHMHVSIGLSQLSSCSKYCLHFFGTLFCTITKDPSSFFRNFSCVLYPPLIELIFWYSSRVLFALWSVSMKHGFFIFFCLLIIVCVTTFIVSFIVFHLPSIVSSWFISKSDIVSCSCRLILSHIMLSLIYLFYIFFDAGFLSFTFSFPITKWFKSQSAPLMV